MAADMVDADGSELLEQLNRAQARTEEIRRHLERADQVIARPINGQDGEGAVEIVLGTSGAVEAVHLDHDWRELVVERGLPAAVAEAYRAAHGSRLSDWCGALRESLGARGRVPLGLRPATEPPEGPEPTWPEPDLSAVSTESPDEQVAAQVRAALDRAPGECAGQGDSAGQGDPGGQGDSAGTDPDPSRGPRERAQAAFASLSAAITAAPGWLDITLVVAGAQTALGTLREVTEQLLALRPAGKTENDALTRSLDAAAVRARSLIGIPEGVGLAVAAVGTFVTSLRSAVGTSAEAAGASATEDSQHLCVR